jgi:SPP1 gp7 family putative phage head morphogenesis protein
VAILSINQREKIMPEIFQQSFWDDDEGDLWDDLAEAIIDIYFDGVDGGMEALPPDVRVFADFDLVNTNALEYARKYRYDLIKGITDTTRKQTQKAVSDWIRSGAPLPALEAVLEKTFGSVRAQMIAQTESTRVFQDANAAAWQSTGLVSEMRYNTVVDDKVCPMCSPLDGLVFELGDSEHSPPRHIGCRCFTTPVLDEEAYARLLDEALQ